MKTWLLILILATLPVGAQNLIEKKDGTKIEPETIHVEPGNKRIVYFLKDSKKEMRVKFTDLKQAIWNGLVFKTFSVDGKDKGFYVIAEAGGKTLVSSKRTRIKSRGGFESTYNHYEVAVLQQGKIVESLSFTDENSDKKAGERAKVIPMVKGHFTQCPKLAEKVSAFESPASDTKNTTILVLLNDPVFVKCE